MDFKTWLLQIGKSKRTAESYSGAMSGSISDWAKDASLLEQNLIEICEVKEFIKLSNEIKKLDIFQERDTRGNRMYSVALNHYENYLKEIYQVNLKSDIEKILYDSTIRDTEKSQLVNARIGQGKFRGFQIDYWQTCALTGFSDTRFLVASHIKPWCDADNDERLDRYNGLLLLPNLDKVFDLGFITFNSKGNIVISNELENFKSLGLSKDMKLDLHDSHKNYMTYHRDMVFDKSLNKH